MVRDRHPRFGRGCPVAGRCCLDYRFQSVDVGIGCAAAQHGWHFLLRRSLFARVVDADEARLASAGPVGAGGRTSEGARGQGSADPEADVAGSARWLRHGQPRRAQGRAGQAIARHRNPAAEVASRRGRTGAGPGAGRQRGGAGRAPAAAKAGRRSLGV